VALRRTATRRKRPPRRRRPRTGAASSCPIAAGTLSSAMSPTWIWMQIAIVVFVLIGMIVAITKLA
jgi:hypothetical protein